MPRRLRPPAQAGDGEAAPAGATRAGGSSRNRQVSTEDLDEFIFEEALRTVGKGNTVSLNGLTLQIQKQPGRPTCAGLTVQVRRHLTGHYSVRRGTQVLGLFDPEGRARTTPRTTQTRDPALARLRSPPAPAGQQAHQTHGTEDLAKADRSLVKTQRTIHLSITGHASAVILADGSGTAGAAGPTRVARSRGAHRRPGRKTPRRGAALPYQASELAADNSATIASISGELGRSSKYLRSCSSAFWESPRSR